MISISLRTLLLTSVLFVSSVKAQRISGFWVSRDKARIYNINNDEDQFRAILFSSGRQGEDSGTLVLELVRVHRNKYAGIIHSVDHSLSTRVKVSFDKKDPDILVLRLRRMFLTVTIKWYRVNE